VAAVDIPETEKGRFDSCIGIRTRDRSLRCHADPDGTASSKIYDPEIKPIATEKADAVIVGVGAAGACSPLSSAKHGRKVVGLECGPRLKTADFVPHAAAKIYVIRATALARSVWPITGARRSISQK